MVKLVDTADLKSAASAWGFESLPGHHTSIHISDVIVFTKTEVDMVAGPWQGRTASVARRKLISLLCIEVWLRTNMLTCCSLNSAQSLDSRWKSSNWGKRLVLHQITNAGQSFDTDKRWRRCADKVIKLLLPWKRKNNALRTGWIGGCLQSSFKSVRFAFGVPEQWICSSEQ